MRRFCYLVVSDECALKIFAKVGETQTAWACALATNEIIQQRGGRATALVASTFYAEHQC